MPRKNKTLSPSEETANEKALDAAAGVRELSKEEALPRASETTEEWAARVREGRPLVDAPPPLTLDTREKLLLKHASEKWTDGFFADFTDTGELTELTCRLGVRVLASIICSQDPEYADVKDKIAAMRVILNIEYGESASMNPAKFIPTPPVATIPKGGVEGLDAAMDKVRKFGGKK